MSKSTGSMDNLDWAVNLACPPSACTNSVKEILNRGISSYVWDEVSSKISPVNDVVEARKNILLHYLKNQVPVSLIQYMRNTKRLKSERTIIASQIEEKQTQCMKTDTSLRQNGMKLAKVRSSKEVTEMKKNILELKCQKIKSEIIDFDKFFTICSRLLPPSNTNIDETIVNESRALVGAISSRADKREALKKLSENLEPIAISQLWHCILNKRIEDTEKLVNHGFQLELLKTTKKEHGQHLSIGIAKACGQHIICTNSMLFHGKKRNDERTRGMDYMEKIEDLMIFNSNDAIHDWVSVAVEIADLEKKQQVMESEIDILKTMLDEAEYLHNRNLQLAYEIHDIYMHTEQCAYKMQQALLKFEPASQSILILKNQLIISLNMIAALNSQFNIGWLENNLSSEIEYFQDNLDINAANKILLSGRVGAYRHVSTCMSNALVVSPGFTSSSPVYRTPLYHLFHCFENLMINSVLINEKEELDAIENMERNLTAICTSSSIRENDTLELLHETNSTCAKCCKEIASFNSIYDSWVYQFVNEVMSMNEDTVHGATYSEWVQRFTTLVYVIHRNK